MQLCIHAQGIDLTEKIKRKASQKLDLALDRMEDDIVRVSVYLIDTNGPFLGGVDKACRIVVQIQHQDSLVLEDIDENVDVVLDRITDRLGVAASQRMDALAKIRGPVRRWLNRSVRPAEDIDS
jgi:ribosome-associated translation inhibitor RaiA